MKNEKLMQVKRLKTISKIIFADDKWFQIKLMYENSQNNILKKICNSDSNEFKYLIKNVYNKLLDLTFLTLHFFF